LLVAGVNKRALSFRPYGMRYVQVVSRIREAIGRFGE
jgi:hypothetical protein